MDARRPASLPACCTGIGQMELTKDTGNRIDGKSWTKLLHSRCKEVLCFCKLLRNLVYLVLNLESKQTNKPKQKKLKQNQHPLFILESVYNAEKSIKV